MKVIDLLNKIANGEFQKEFKFIVCMINGIKNTKITNINWTFKDGLIFNVNDAGDRFYYFLESGIYRLNDEIEIIEEEKEIEEIKSGQLFTIDDGEINYNFQVCKDKINKLTDELNKIKKEGK